MAKPSNSRTQTFKLLKKFPSIRGHRSRLSHAPIIELRHLMGLGEKILSLSGDVGGKHCVKEVSSVYLDVSEADLEV